MSLLLFKIVITPLLIGGATVLQRRFSGAVGGLVTGLPVTSAPLSVFLALQNGPVFATKAAVGTLLGLIAMAGFCATYARAARGKRWLPAMALATVACAALFTVLARVPQRPGLAAAMVFPVLLGLVLLVGRQAPGAPVPHPWWDLPARMMFALAAVIGITAASANLGPTWSGMLATLPVLSAIMGGFTHRQAGPEPAKALLRGIIVGSLGAAAFNLVVAMELRHAGVASAYCAALLAALCVAALGHALLGSRMRLREADIVLPMPFRACTAARRPPRPARATPAGDLRNTGDSQRSSDTNPGAHAAGGRK